MRTFLDLSYGQGKYLSVSDEYFTFQLGLSKLAQPPTAIIA